MQIAYIEVQNFRKLKSCCVELSDKQTVFVGANNSGKTSAMDALILFLEKSKQKDILTTDFTLSNWHSIDKIGEQWLDDTLPLNLNHKVWDDFLPSLDVWVHVSDNEVHYVSHLIPTLNWSGEMLGIRICFEPEDIEQLYKDFRAAYRSAKLISDGSLKKEGQQGLKLWPQSMRDFLDKKLHHYFTMNSYILDPYKQKKPIHGVAQPQKIISKDMSMGKVPFDGLFKIDIINAQRGFSDANTPERSNSSARGLSAQLRDYFAKHLNPSELPGADDLDALQAIETARTAFDAKLHESFKPALGELEKLGYPGFSDPEIILTSRINPIDGLDHEAAVQFNVMKHRGNVDLTPLCLPEKYNGLGYQNLVSMVFNLIRFRDEWMRKGKASKNEENDEYIIQPLHLVLIEEPEAHLHAQVQQVFIKKAYDVLRNHPDLLAEKFSTQLIISTHSSHIAHAIDFACLRYFRRNPALNLNEVPNATVVNLSTTFGQENQTSKFVTRYLKTTHCDLFFADAAIFVEGPAERMLIPHFIKHKHKNLDFRFITLLEIGGSHAHRLKQLIEDLGLLTLVITDIDSIKEDRTVKTQPKREKKYRSGNFTLKDWLPKKEGLDELLNTSEQEKISETALVRVAYQSPFQVKFNTASAEEALAYTFEDALVLTNIDLFKGMTKSTGLIGKMCSALNKGTLNNACAEMFEALDNGKKAEMALDLLFFENSTKLEPPKYIADGLNWLEEGLKIKSLDFATNGVAGFGAIK